MKSNGFTLVELVAVLIILSALALGVFSSFKGGEISQVQASRDDFVAALLYGQQLAMARDSAANPIRVVATANSVSITENGAPLLHGTVQYPLVFTGGVTVSPAATLNFDKLGRTQASVFTLSKSGASATVTVSDSGYAN